MQSIKNKKISKILFSNDESPGMKKLNICTGDLRHIPNLHIKCGRALSLGFLDVNIYQNDVYSIPLLIAYK